MEKQSRATKELIASLMKDEQNRTIRKLNQTEMELNRTKEELNQTKEELKQTKEELRQTNEKLDHACRNSHLTSLALQSAIICQKRLPKSSWFSSDITKIAESHLNQAQRFLIFREPRSKLDFSLTVELSSRNYDSNTLRSVKNKLIAYKKYCSFGGDND
ncbi:unnamed protein product [Allacma fusca]|uniref:Uncharacterized protein n=1 Tax=Allacma fusca TaxID=39272 RepID=A0A8J2KHJ0_9HEXA|nr:unnamed protein product [Allacma fusca]